MRSCFHFSWVSVWVHYLWPWLKKYNSATCRPQLHCACVLRYLSWHSDRSNFGGRTLYQSTASRKETAVTFNLARMFRTLYNCCIVVVVDHPSVGKLWIHGRFTLEAWQWERLQGWICSKKVILRRNFWPRKKISIYYCRSGSGVSLCLLHMAKEWQEHTILLR